MNARAGYSLLEVLVAFVVMTLVLTAILPRQAVQLGRAEQAAQRGLALDYSRSLLDQMGVSKPLPQPGRSTTAYGDWRIEVLTERFASPLGQGPDALNVTIFVRDRNDRALATLSAVFAP